MKKGIEIGIKALLTVVFAVAVYVFYAVAYRFHITYQEQYQMFLFTGDYAWQVLGRPGGLAEYVSRFLVQFFYVASWGASIVTVLLVGLQLLTACAFGGSTKQHNGLSLTKYALSFVPATLMWMALCDENGMVTTVIALILAIVAVVVTKRIGNYGVRMVVIAIITPVMYLIAGPIGLAYTVMAVFDGSSLTARRLAIAALLLAEAAICPWLAQFVFPYPTNRLYYGLNYYRYPFVAPVMAWWATGAAAVLVCLASFVKIGKHWAVGVVAVCIVAIGGVVGVHLSMNKDKEEVFGYDNMVRHRQWYDIVEKAVRRHPDKPMSVAALNLALAKSGVLGDHMFRFYQNGTEGLVPKFERDLTMPLLSAEIFYNLGMVNSAQRFTYEAQEAIPDYQKSARCYKRLAETHIINGDYEAARKYLKTLQNTLLYDDWATQMLAILGDEQAINSHPDFGQLRQLRYKTDHFFSEDEMDSMLGLLFLDNQTNKTAFEYLLAWCLLQRDLNRFYDCYVLGKNLGYDHIPASYQEALALKWTMEHDSWEGLPFSLSPQVMQRMQQYIIDRRQSLPLTPKYTDTYWTYYFQD